MDAFKGGGEGGGGGVSQLKLLTRRSRDFITYMKDPVHARTKESRKIKPKYRKNLNMCKTLRAKTSTQITNATQFHTGLKILKQIDTL